MMDVGDVSNSTGEQPNFSGIQTLITPTSQYVFPPSVVSTSLLPQQLPSCTNNNATTSLQLQETQIQKYPPFIGQAVTPSQPGVMGNTNCRLAMVNSVSTPVASTPFVVTGTSDPTRKG